jgi:hypothetical protein
MLGSTFIAENDSSRLTEITSAEDLSGFATLELDAMITLDFEMLANEAGVRWAESEPVHFDEEGGRALFKVNETGLLYVLGRATKLTEVQKSDLSKLAAFVRAHGSSHIYELAVF